MPDSFGNSVITPEELLMPVRASRSKWLRALDLNSEGMPRRVDSVMAWTALVNCAVCCGVSCEPARMPESGAQVPFSFTTLRMMKRCIFCWLTKLKASGEAAPPQPPLSVSISIRPAFSSSVIWRTRSSTRLPTGWRQSS